MVLFSQKLKSWKSTCPFGKPAYLGDTRGGIFQGGSVLGIQIIKRVT